jgi:hypothetical protein
MNNHCSYLAPTCAAKMYIVLYLSQEMNASFFVRIFGIQIDFKFLVLLYVNRAVGFDANFKKVGSQFAISHGRVQLCAENLPGL